MSLWTGRFLRNLEALQAMKVAPFVVKIEQAGQVNVGEKQINLSGDTQAEAAEASTEQGLVRMAALPDGRQSSDKSVPDGLTE